MHLARKLFHATGIGIVLIYRLIPVEQTWMAVGLWVCAGLLLMLDVVRHRLPALQAKFLVLFKSILDKKDERGLNGSTLYFTGCAVAVTMFPSKVACVGILALALGDSMAAIIGSSVKSPSMGRVSLAGSGACFVAATLAARIFFGWGPAVAAGAAAAVLEAISGSKLDNLTMPIGVAAVVAWLV
ncbi:MAG: diacylglycerol/polyprenol kinase family protein [Planctomycetota bacterium]|jgi:dolichol kinase